MLEDWTTGTPLAVSYAQAVRAAEVLAERFELAIGSVDGQPLVAICFEEGVLLVVCQLAALLRGDAFVLLDRALPVARLSYLLSDSGAALLVGPKGQMAATLEAAGGVCVGGANRGLRTLEIEEPLELLRGAVASEAAAADASDDSGARQVERLLTGDGRTRPAGALAYVCYTSGSTGRPKGVAVRHEALRSYAVANARAHGVGRASRVLLATAVSFDPCIGEAWTALLAGATLCLPSRMKVREAMGETLSATRTTHVCSTPALWESIGAVGPPPPLPSLRCVTLGGEKMSRGLIERWAATPRSRGSSEVGGAASESKAVDLRNVYGVTECTVYQSSSRVVDEAGAGMLGSPLDGCTLHLLDDEMRPIPPPHGELPRDPDGPLAPEPSLCGQLAIGGRQLAVGYLNQPALTADRFVEWRRDEPASAERSPADRAAAAQRTERLYLTGDCACWCHGAAGSATAGRAPAERPPALRLLGRQDRQVKLNGVRLELGEVEGTLAECSPLVARAAAWLFRGALVCAVQTSGGDGLAASSLLCEAAASLVHLHARRWLPAAISPSRVTVVASMPLTPTGKIDRRALAKAVEEAAEAEAEAEAAAEAASRAAAGAGQGGVSEEAAELEKVVGDVWREVLGVNHVNRRSNFRELGGDSIKALQVSRTLAYSLEHAHDAPPTRAATRSGAADEADYGVLRGVFSPAALLRTPLLGRYVAFLLGHGVRPNPAYASGGPPASGPAGPVGAEESDELTCAAAVTVAETEAEAEAAAAADDELRDDMIRLRSEVAPDASASEQLLLQLALTAAARAGEAVLATTALRMGADPAPRPARLLRGRSVVNELGFAPLHVAAREGRSEVLSLLLAASAPPTLLSNAGLPPLHVAAASPKGDEALSLLLAAGAPLAMRDDRRQTALHTACRAGRLEAVVALLEAGAELELRDRWHRTALHWAVVNRRHAVLRLLVRAGAVVNGLVMPTKKHTKSTSLPLETPLHSAARLPPAAAAPLVRTLLAARAEPGRSDQFGQTPLHFAVASSALRPCARAPDGDDGDDDGDDGRPEGGDGLPTSVVGLLLSAGARPCCKDHEGRTPLERASSLGVSVSSETTELLEAAAAGGAAPSAATRAAGAARTPTSFRFGGTVVRVEPLAAPDEDTLLFDDGDLFGAGAAAAFDDTGIHYVWPASVALCRWLEAERMHDVRGARVMELGAGLGLPSLFCCHFAERTLAIDCNERAVTKLNAAFAEHGAAGTASAQTLWWDEADVLAQIATSERISLLLAADVVYPMKDASPLLAALALLRQRLPSLTIAAALARRDPAHAASFANELAALCPESGPGRMRSHEMEAAERDPLYGAARVDIYWLPPAAQEDATSKPN